MQEAKYYLRAIGDVSKDPTRSHGIVSAADAEADLGHNYLSNGWKIHSVHYVGAIRDEKGNEIAYRMYHVLTRDDHEVPVVEAMVEASSKVKK